MAFIKGTATNHQTALDALFQAMTRISVQTMAVNAGGTGYTVGDLLAVSGGTNTIAAVARVLTAPGGVVGTVAIDNAGVYTVAPATSGAATTGGTGTGCTLNTTNAANGWVTQRSTAVAGTAQSAVIGAGGTGYTVGDTLTLSGGTVYISATFQVLTAPGGVVGTVALLNPGDYVATPANNAATTGGTGTGCTLTVTYGTAGSGTERALIVKGTGLGGTDTIYCGVRSYSDVSSGAKSWEVAGFTGFNSGLTWDNQPGVSPGRNTDHTQSLTVPLSSTSTTYWFSVNGRRAVAVFKIGTSYLSMYMGFLNPFATTGENPYPLCIAGCTNQWDCLPSNSNISLSSIADPTRHTNTSPSAMQVRMPDGQWYSVFNSTNNGGSRLSSSAGFVAWPSGGVFPAVASGDDWWTQSQTVFSIPIGVVPQTGSPGSPIIRINRVPNSPAPTPALFPVTIITSTPTTAVIGELDNVFWFHAVGGVVSEDTITVGTDRYRCFQSGNRSDLWAYFAVKEN